MVASNAVVVLICIALSAGGAFALENGLARTPPMGWSSWNHFHRNYNETIFWATARVMAANGMKDAGYEFINIDGGWWAGSDTGHAQRNSTGYMQVNMDKFPRGIPRLVGFVHSLGLKWGHYTDAGKHFCNGDSPASYGYEEQDAKLFVSFGADMVKIDACGSTPEDHEPTMAKWARLFNESGRPVLISNCHNGCQTSDWSSWCPTSANMWRTSGDIASSWKRVMANPGTLVGRGEYGKPGAWNDPDFLVIGNGDLSLDEARAHFSLWCVTSSPPIAGNDLTQMTAVWAKPLPNWDYGVVLFNSDDSQLQEIILPLSKLGPFRGCYLHDIWTGKDSRTSGAVIKSGHLASHAATFYYVSRCYS